MAQFIRCDSYVEAKLVVAEKKRQGFKAVIQELCDYNGTYFDVLYWR